MWAPDSSEGYHGRERREPRKVGQRQSDGNGGLSHPTRRPRLRIVAAQVETFDSSLTAGRERASWGEAPWEVAGSKKEAPEQLDRPDTSLVQVKDSKERI